MLLLKLLPRALPWQPMLSSSLSSLSSSLLFGLRREGLHDVFKCCGHSLPIFASACSQKLFDKLVNDFGYLPIATMTNVASVYCRHPNSCAVMPEWIAALGLDECFFCCFDEDVESD